MAWKPRNHPVYKGWFTKQLEDGRTLSISPPGKWCLQWWVFYSEAGGVVIEDAVTDTTRRNGRHAALTERAAKAWATRWLARKLNEV